MKKEVTGGDKKNCVCKSLMKLDVIDGVVDQIIFLDKKSIKIIFKNNKK